MSVKFYTDIFVADNYFSIVECDRKPHGALSTLLRIEEVMRRGLQYKKDSDDQFTNLPKDELYAALKQRAEGIRDGYIKKTTALSSFIRFFWGVSKKEKVIQATFDRIVNLAAPLSILKLPNETIQHIIGFLKTSELGKLAQVNKLFESHIQLAVIQRARGNGYEGRDFAEAKDYLNNLFQFISDLVGYIPEKYVVRKGRWPFWHHDFEATLKNIQYLNEEEENRFKINLTHGLNFAIEKGKAQTVKLLLKHGAVAIINNLGFGIEGGLSPLHLAITENKPEIVELLLANGADLNIFDRKHGLPPLVWAAEYGNEEIVKKLIEAGADVNALCFGGLNGALAKAIIRNYPKIVKLLLESGAAATINNVGVSGQYPLHRAIIEDSNPEIVRLLLAHGANRALLNYQNKTAYKLTSWHQFRLRSLLR